MLPSIFNAGVKAYQKANKTTTILFVIVTCLNFLYFFFMFGIHNGQNHFCLGAVFKHVLFGV